MPIIVLQAYAMTEKAALGKLNLKKRSIKKPLGTVCNFKNKKQKKNICEYF